jgi:hypothetical protein
MSAEHFQTWIFNTIGSLKYLDVPSSIVEIVPEVAAVKDRCHNELQVFLRKEGISFQFGRHTSSIVEENIRFSHHHFANIVSHKT